MANSKKGNLVLAKTQKKVNGGVLVTSQSKDGKIKLTEFNKNDKNSKLNIKTGSYNDKNVSVYQEEQTYSYSSTSSSNKKNKK